MLPFASPTKIIYDSNCIGCGGHSRCLLCGRMIHSYNHKIKLFKVIYHSGCLKEFLQGLINEW